MTKKKFKNYQTANHCESKQLGFSCEKRVLIKLISDKISIVILKVRNVNQKLKQSLSERILMEIC